jgi:predicted aspartyl protease
MTSARAISGRFPYLPIQVQVHGRTYTVEALIDTGFDGDVVLPAGQLASDEPDDYHGWTLADGLQVFAPFYLGTVSVGNLGSFTAAITALGDEPIVGRGVTDRFRLILDHGQRVIVEP